MSQPLPAYDAAGIKAIVAALWRHRTPTSRVFIGSIPSNANKDRAAELQHQGTPPNQLPPECRTAWRAFGPDDGKSLLAMLNADLGTKNLYFKPARFVPLATRPLAMHVMEVGSAWLDIDIAKMEHLEAGTDWNAVAADVLLASQCPPTLIIRTGGGLHAHWAYDRVLTEKHGGFVLAQQVNAELTRVFSGDPSVTQIAAAMRIPGTYNHNRSGVQVSLVHEDMSRTYDPCALLEWAMNEWRAFPHDPLKDTLSDTQRRLILASERLAEEHVYEQATGIKRKTLEEWAEVIADLSREGSSNTSGGRNRAATVLAGKLYSMGHTEESAILFMKEKGCTLPDHEIEYVCGSVARTRMRESNDIIYKTNAEKALAEARAQAANPNTAPVAEQYKTATIADPSKEKGNVSEPKQHSSAAGGHRGAAVGGGAGDLAGGAGVDDRGGAAPGLEAGDDADVPDAIVNAMAPTLAGGAALGGLTLPGAEVVVHVSPRNAARRTKQVMVVQSGPRFTRAQVKPGMVRLDGMDPSCPIANLRAYMMGETGGNPEDPFDGAPAMMVPISMSILNPGGQAHGHQQQAPSRGPGRPATGGGGRAKNKAPNLITVLDLAVNGFKKWLTLFGMEVLYTNGDWWVYESATSVWASTDAKIVEGMIRSFVTDALDKSATKSQVAEILAELQAQVTHIKSPFTSPSRRNIIVCACGTVVDIDQDLEIPGDPSHYLTEADILQSRWDRTATCPAWDKAIRDIFSHAPGNERPRWVKLIEEWMSQVLIRRTRSRATSKGLLLIGPKAAGKSVILDTLRGVIRPDGHSGSDISALGGNFPAMDLIGKTAWLVDEIKRGTTVTDDWLKRIITNDHLTINRKFMDHWYGKLNIVIGFAANDLPDFNDGSGALLDRMLIVRCTTRFPEGDPRRDERLVDKLHAERDGILQMMVEAAHDLMARGRFDIPQSITDHIREVGEEQNDFAYFVGHGFVAQGEECYVLHSHIRTAYLGYLLSRYGDKEAVVKRRDLSAIHQEIQNQHPHTKTTPTSGRADYRKLGIHTTEAFVSWFDIGWKADPKNNGQTNQTVLATLNGTLSTVKR